MFKFIALLVAFASAAAFSVSSSRAARSYSLKMGFEDAIGAQAPLGSLTHEHFSSKDSSEVTNVCFYFLFLCTGFWDPLGLLKDADQEKFDRLRTVETKHGRIAQLAILGHLVTTAGYRLPTSLTPGYDLSNVKAGLAALTDLPVEAIFGTLLTVAAIEGGYAARKDEIEEAQLKASGWDQETIDKKLAIELNNGRAAQMGILALMVHEKLDNNPYIINSLLGYPVPFN